MYPGNRLEARVLPLTSLHGEKPVIVYCDAGSTSAGAARQLRASGFNKVVTLSGGLNSWRQENLPLVKGAAKKDGKH